MKQRPQRTGSQRPVRRMNARTLCVDALSQWQTESLPADVVLHAHLDALPDDEKPLFNELFYGVIRHLSELDFLIAQLRPEPVDMFTRNVLRSGLYQLFHLRVPDHAAVHESVNAARRAHGLVNAVLRRAVRERTDLEENLALQPLAVRMSHPKFLVERWLTHMTTADVDALCKWNNTPAPIIARLHDDAESQAATRAALAGREIPGFPDFLEVDRIPYQMLQSGKVYLQDPSTSLAPRLLAPQPGESVLDACAAPGGKTCLLADLMGHSGRLVAVDSHPARLEKLSANLTRMRVGAELLEIDWLNRPQPPDILFDRILVDAPCSNTGVLRRRVDARWRISDANFAEMQNLQSEILDAVAPWLRPGGSLVYSTCSIDPEENEAVVERFLREHPHFTQVADSASHPLRDGIDGSYAALMKRTG